MEISKNKRKPKQFKHPVEKGIVTVGGKPSDEIRKGTLGSIIQQAGLKGQYKTWLYE